MAISEISTIKKHGSSYFVLLPAKVNEIFNWDENTLVQIDFDSDVIIIKKVSQLTDEYKKRAGIDEI